MDRISMNKQEIYKRVKINWWIILMLVGTYIHMIFGYINQWGNNPIDKAGLIITAIIWIVLLFVLWRFILTIDDKFVIFRSDLWTPIKIYVSQIKDVIVVNVSLWSKMTAKFEKYNFDFVKQAISIQLKNGKTYQNAIKNAQKIKEEIEKRMITNNITSS
jgi:hypothetical protein